jgi:hypothetical protein
LHRTFVTVRCFRAALEYRSRGDRTGTTEQRLQKRASTGTLSQPFGQVVKPSSVHQDIPSCRNSDWAPPWNLNARSLFVTCDKVASSVPYSFTNLLQLLYEVYLTLEIFLLTLR